jgi:TatD DNase family protein
MLVDTHAHIHFDQYRDRLDEVLAAAQSAGVERIICVGVDDEDSARAVKLAARHPQLIAATVGLHPHDAHRGPAALARVAELAREPGVVAIGECGLDYFRELSPRADQERALRFQIELGLELGKPMVFHVRDAFAQFFGIFDDYSGVRGVVHCFTSHRADMQQAVDRGLAIALNGIMTFTTDESQLEAARAVPLDSLVLETDCPFLTPAPKRGQVNEPANLAITARFLAGLRGEEYEVLARQTTANAKRLFGLAAVK